MGFTLLGILNAQASGAVGAGGSFDLLETTILTTSTASIKFTGLGDYSGYKHLQIRATTRTTRAATNDVVLLTFNGDTGANYAYHELRGNGSSVTSGAGASQNNLRLSISQTSDNAANTFSPVVADILDFNSSTKNTTVRSLSGMTETNNFIDFRSGLYNDTSAITSFTLDNFGTGFEIGTRVSIYGMGTPELTGA